MRIAVVGIGGVGGFFGGKLAREYAGSEKHEIIFIARGEHLKAIQHNGLQLFTREGDYVAWPNIATDDPSVAGLFDLAFFCVKSYSLESLALSLKNNIHRNTVVIPLQNGVESAERLRRVMPDADVISGSVYIVASVDVPGVVRQTDGACKMIFGTDNKQSAEKYSPILDILLQAKIDAKLTGKISKALWTKYLLMCPLGSLTAATGKTYGALLANPDYRTMLRSMMEEVVAVAQAQNVHLPENAVDKTMAMVGGFDYDSKTSMQLDREKGRQTEVDTLTAYVCRVGRDTGVPTPVHDKVYRQLIP